jgi:REP element-mobilizing transposase RayT
MLGLLTWPVYGTWFECPYRGWIDRDVISVRSVPEPTRRGAGGALKWPAASLDRRQRDLIVRDLARLAGLRGFELHMVAAAPSHVHVLLSCDDRDVPRLVQLIKGSLARTLTVAAGDTPAFSTRDEALPHHKWWTRQYSFLRINDDETRQRVTAQLRAHEATGARVWEKGLRD